MRVSLVEETALLGTILTSLRYRGRSSTVRRSPRKLAIKLPAPLLSPFQHFFDVHDVIYLVTSQCSWKDLVSMIHTNKVLRGVVFRLIRTRIKMFISPFIPSDKIGTFFDLLGDSRAAMFGGVVRCIMSTTSSVYRLVSPDRLDIVVPSIVSRMSRFRRWMRFLTAIGYKEIMSCDASEDLA